MYYYCGRYTTKTHMRGLKANHLTYRVILYNDTTNVINWYSKTQVKNLLQKGNVIKGLEHITISDTHNNQIYCDKVEQAVRYTLTENGIKASPSTFVSAIINRPVIMGKLLNGLHFHYKNIDVSCIAEANSMRLKLSGITSSSFQVCINDLIEFFSCLGKYNYNLTNVIYDVWLPDTDYADLSLLQSLKLGHNRIPCNVYLTGTICKGIKFDDICFEQIHSISFDLPFESYTAIQFIDCQSAKKTNIFETNLIHDIVSMLNYDITNGCVWFLSCSSESKLKHYLSKLDFLDSRIKLVFLGSFSNKLDVERVWKQQMGSYALLKPSKEQIVCFIANMI